jgi:acetyl esterase/lipase
VRGWLPRHGLALLVLAASVAAITAGSGGGSGADTRHEASYAHATMTRQGVDAYWHSAGTPQPALLLLHGGFFGSGGRTDWTGAARYFADHGFAVFSADYRRGADAAWPGPRDDAVAAVEWIRAHAGAFDADAAHVSVLGSQAGGQLATMLATYGAGRARVDAAVGLSPIDSPYRAWAQAPTAGATAARRVLRDETVILHRCHPDRADTGCWARWTDSSAAEHASGADDAPMYLVHSSGDTVPAVQSTDLRDAEVAKGMNAADITVRTVPGGDSGGALLTTGLRAAILTWLKARAQATGTARTRTSRDAAGPAGVATVSPPTLNPRAAPTTPTTTPATGMPMTGTYAYGTDPQQRLDAYYIPTGERQPVLVIIHGGYWYENDKSGWAANARWFARRGYAVFSIDYRLDGRFGWAAQRTDALDAIAWIKEHAAGFTADPHRVLLLGSSSGGQIATAVGTYGTGARYVRGVVALSPVNSPYRAYEDGQVAGATAAEQKLRDNTTLLNRCPPASADPSCRHRWVDSDVKNHAGAGDAPMYLLHSRGDFVPAGHSTGLCTALKAKKVGCTLTVVPGSAHGGAILDADGIRTRILSWLRAHD